MFHMTVFDDDGKKLYDSPIEATSDEEAKEKGTAWLKEHRRQDAPYRIFHSSGRLIAFHSHKGKHA